MQALAANRLASILLQPHIFDIFLLQITIMDVNDNSPMFAMQRQDLFIPESTPVNTTFYLPTAEDRDSQVFGVASYELEAHTQGMFILISTKVSQSKISHC